MKNKKSIVYKWVISYMIILLSTATVIIFIYLGMKNILEREINKSNDLFLSQVQQYIDELVNDSKVLGINICLNKNVQEIMKFKPSLQEKDMKVISECIKDLQAYRISNSSVDNVYIYFENINKIVSDKVCINPIDFYETFLSHKNVSYDNWLKSVYGSYNGRYISNNIQMTYSSNKIDSISYIRCAPISRPDKKIANIVINMNASKIFNMVEKVEKNYKSKLIILDSDNKVVWHTPEFNKLCEKINYKNMNMNKDMFIIKDGSEKEYIYYASSKSESWKYVLIMPGSIFSYKLINARKIMCLAMIIFVIIGMIITIMMIKRNYKPVKSLINNISKKANVKLNGKFNEYTYIQQVMEKVLVEKDEIKLKFVNQNELLKFRIIEKLLKGTLDNIEMLRTYNIDIKSEYFSVLLFYLDDSKINEENTFTSYKILTLIQNIFLNLGNEYLGENEYYFTDVDGMVACVINFNSKYDYQSILNLCNRIKNDIINRYNLDLSIVISNIHKTLRGIQQAYDEVLRIIDYKEKINIDGVLSYDDIPKVEGNLYKYALDKEQQLINYIKLSDAEKCKEIISDVFADNFKNINFSPYMAKCLIFSVVGTIFKTINEVTQTEDEIYLKEVNNIENFIERLIKTKSLSKSEDDLYELVEDVCYYIRSNKKSNAIVHDIEEFVLKNYSDSNLSVASIADNFKMNSCYVSRIFKEQFGESILDFLNKVRVERSKEFLKNRKLNIEEVANSVGYNNVRTFTRIFNKYEGVTPGKYRDI